MKWLGSLQGMAIAAALLLAAGFGGGWTANGWRLNASHQRYVAEQSALNLQQSQELVAANRKATEQEAAARESNRKITNELQIKLDAATADRDRTQRLLRAAYETAAARPELPESAGERPVAPAGRAASADEIDAAVADVIVESRRNADRYDALIRQLTPQL